jgi:hypothetical protein
MTEAEITDLCLGNRDAAAFALAYLAYCHCVDDLVDRDNDALCSQDHVIRTQMEMFFALSRNPFYLQNRDGLLALMLQGFLAWGDSMKWQHSGDESKVHDADVVKGQYHEVLFHVALIVGGVEHARKVTSKFRSYDHEPNNVKT